MIAVTQNAAQQAHQIMQENDIPTGGGLRIGVKAGGCSGLNYVLDIVEAPEANDRSFVMHDLNIFCDPKSYLYLTGLQIDYESTMTGGGFKFENPNARRSCGCGTSFAV
jgi:iron-sulfur cluster assembly protein